MLKIRTELKHEFSSYRETSFGKIEWDEDGVSINAIEDESAKILCDVCPELSVVEDLKKAEEPKKTSYYKSTAAKKESVEKSEKQDPIPTTPALEDLSVDQLKDILDAT